MNVRASERPFAVANRKEDVAGFLNALQNLTAGTATDALRREKTSAFAASIYDFLPCLLEPIAAEIAAARDASRSSFRIRTGGRRVPVTRARIQSRMNGSSVAPCWRAVRAMELSLACTRAPVWLR